MGIVFRQSIKTTLVTFTGALLGTLIVWLSTKYAARQQFGFIGNLTNNALVLSQICILGVNSTLLVYIHKYTDEDARKRVLITLSLLIPLLFAVLGAIPFYFLKPWVLHHFQAADIPYMQRYYMLLPVYAVMFILQVLLEQYLGSQMKVAVAAFMREVVLRILNIVLIILFAFGVVSFNVLVIGSVLIYLVPILIYVFIALRTKGFGLSLKLSAYNGLEYKEMLHFSWYHFLLSLSITLMSYLDTITLPLYDHSGFSSLAVYRVAVFLISFLQIPSKAMLTPTVTVLAQAMANKEHGKAKDVFVRSSINVLLATVFMAVLIICNLGNAVAVLPPGYEQITLAFVILFIGRIVDLSTGLNDAILSITNYYKFSFYVSVVMIGILFGLLRWLVPIYGVFGAAWATSVTLVVFNVCKYIFVWRKLDMQPYSMKTVLVLIAGGASFATGYFLPHFFDNKGHVYVSAIADTALRSTVIVVVYLIMLYWLKPSADLVEYVGSIKKNKRLF